MRGSLDQLCVKDPKSPSIGAPKVDRRRHEEALCAPDLSNVSSQIRALSSGPTSHPATPGSRCRRLHSLRIPSSSPPVSREALAGVGPDDAHPLDLFRVHWHNGANRVDPVDVPGHVVLPRALTGVNVRIVLALGSSRRAGTSRLVMRTRRRYWRSQQQGGNHDR